MLVVDGETVNKQKDIANTMAKFFVSKVNKIREKISANQYQAIKTYKTLIKRQEEDFRFKSKKIYFKSMKNYKNSNHQTVKVMMR